MVGVRSAFKTAALVSALVVSAAVAQSQGGTGPNGTTSPTPAPATTTASPAKGLRSLATPGACNSATLNVVGTELVIYCSGERKDQVPLASFSELTVGVLSSELTVEALVADSIDKLTINGGTPGQTDFKGVKPNLKFADGVRGLSKLSSLSLTSVNFSNTSINFEIPVTLAYLNVDFTQTSESLSASIVKNLTHNVDLSNSSFDIDNACDSGTIAPAILGVKYQVCTEATSTISDSSSSSPISSSPADSSTGKKSSSSTTLIVVIVLVVAVALVLATVLFTKLTAARKKNTPQNDDNSVNLIGKEDVSGNGKLSFISSDESLRALRLQQNEVTLSKSLGTGRLWLGEFAGAKVIVKRVEAEVSDAYVTKNLMNQSQVLASISHENIVPLVGVTWLAGTDFAVVAEFMDKSNLKSVLADASWQLDIQTKLRMCLDIARGLAYLHDPERSMYIRNFSSGKVLVNSSSECKLNVFDVYPSTTKIEFPVETYGAGEIAWQAPELITHFAPQDPRKINMYAFGVIMCEILARASPFQTLVEELGNTLSDVEIVKRVRRQETLAPHENRREYMRAPQSLRDTIDLCLSLSPLNRPSATDIIVALEAAKLEVSATQQLV